MKLGVYHSSASGTIFMIQSCPYRNFSKLFTRGEQVRRAHSRKHSRSRESCEARPEASRRREGWATPSGVDDAQHSPQIARLVRRQPLAHTHTHRQTHRNENRYTLGGKELTSLCKSLRGRGNGAGCRAAQMGKLGQSTHAS